MSDMDITLIGDKELLQIIHGLDQKTQHVVLKKVLRDTAQKTFVKALRGVSPVRTGNLKRSMGHVSGKSQRVATVFAGPRMGGGHKGYVANILDHAKDNRRYPKNGKALKIGDRFYKSVGPIQKKTNFKQTIIQTIPQAIEYQFKALRTIMEREIKRFARR